MRVISTNELRGRYAVTSVALLLVSGCSGIQSTLDPAGDEAVRVADLFWVMLAASGVIWVLVIGLSVYATVLHPKAHHPKVGTALIVGGGVITPVFVLGGLLYYGLAMMPDLRAAGDGLKVAVSGEQWWWRVTYQPPGRAPVVTANEIRLPVGQRVELTLDSPDVIHSFWIPSLGGKVDMIPGRTNRIVLEPTRTGEFRGACAEFCGTSHALMAFGVVVMEEAAFDRWLAEEARPAVPLTTATQVGHDRFLQAGCGGCHTVRGTPANGIIGPDLTHVGRRVTLGAGILPNTMDSMRRWIADTTTVKPDSRMPSYGMLPAADLEAIAFWLKGLR